MKVRQLGEKTGITTAGPGGAETQKHWCQMSLPFDRNGNMITEGPCGYCGAPLYRDSERVWRYGMPKNELGLFGLIRT